MRKILRTYQDPLEMIWVRAAAEMGMRVERDSTVFASWDGTGVLRIGTPETLDADDSLAQMILHEICHALVQGPNAFALPDWGLDSRDPAQRVREHACLRLQAALADQYDLREFFAATTMFRDYFDRLPDHPLAHDGDPAVELSIAGWQRARHGPWSGPLNQALRLTAAIAELTAEIAPANSLWSRK